jgi:hypothetical protein
MHSQPAEERPTEHILERFPAGPPLEKVLEFRRRPGLGEEEFRLLLCEDAARRAEACHNAGEGRWGIDQGHAEPFPSGIARGMRTAVECP